MKSANFELRLETGLYEDREAEIRLDEEGTTTRNAEENGGMS